MKRRNFVKNLTAGSLGAAALGSSTGLIAGSTIQQKKKVYQKDTKVSCEAIPEEITAVNPNDEPHVAKTRPTTLLSSISATESTNVAVVPKKQLSADDTTQLRMDLSVNFETSSYMGKDHKLTAKPPHAPTSFSPRFMERGIGNRHVVLSNQTAQDNDDSGGRARSKTISVITRENVGKILQYCVEFIHFFGITKLNLI